MKSEYDLHNLTLSWASFIGIVETDLLLNYRQNDTWEIEERPQYILDKLKLELLQMNNSRRYRFIRKIGKSGLLGKAMLYVERKRL